MKGSRDPKRATRSSSERLRGMLIPPDAAVVAAAAGVAESADADASGDSDAEPPSSSPSDTGDIVATCAAMAPMARLASSTGLAPEGRSRQPPAES